MLGGGQVSRTGTRLCLQANQPQDPGDVAQGPRHALLLPPPEVASRASAGELEAKIDITRHAHVAKGARGLESARQAQSGESVRALAGQVAPQCQQAARSGLDDAAEGVEESGLARAVGTDDAH